MLGNLNKELGIQNAKVKTCISKIGSQENCVIINKES